MSDQYSSLRAKTRKRGWRGKVDEFIFKLEQGEFDPKLELDATVAPTANGTPANKPEGGTQESNGDHNGDVDMMNEDAKEDEMDIAMFDAENNNDNGGAPSNDRNNIPMSGQSEEVSVEPEDIQIMIRTIPPDIGRIKIEEVRITGVNVDIRSCFLQVCSKIPGFIYLALGDPMQKRNYYRCGWIRFSEDADVGDVLAKLGEAKVGDGDLRSLQSADNSTIYPTCRSTVSVCKLAIVHDHLSAGCA